MVYWSLTGEGSVISTIVKKSFTSVIKLIPIRTHNNSWNLVLMYFVHNGWQGCFGIRCEKGLIPKPDTITGCGPECVRDTDCQKGYICQNLRCIEKPDPCDPSPCGRGARCMVNNLGNAICRWGQGCIASGQACRIKSSAMKIWCTFKNLQSQNF